jgi:hypothetical protein
MFSRCQAGLIIVATGADDFTEPIATCPLARCCVWKEDSVEKIPVGDFCTGKIQGGRSYSEVVLRTTKHTIVYPSSGPSLEVIDLCLAV